MVAYTQRDRIAAISRLYDGNPDVAWLVERTRAALDAADFLDSYNDDSQLAREAPLLLEIMRRYAADLRGEPMPTETIR